MTVSLESLLARQPYILKQTCECCISVIAHAARLPPAIFETPFDSLVRMSILLEIERQHSVRKGDHTRVLKLGLISLLVKMRQVQHWIWHSLNTPDVVDRGKAISQSSLSGLLLLQGFCWRRHGKKGSCSHQSIATAGWRGPNPFKRWFGSILPALAKHCGITVSEIDTRTVEVQWTG